MKRAKVESVEGYLPFVAVEIAEANRLRLAEKAVVGAMKAALKRETVYPREGKPAKAARVVLTDAEKEARKVQRAIERRDAWLTKREAAEKARHEALAEREAKWAGYWDHICKSPAAKSTVNQAEAA